MKAIHLLPASLLLCAAPLLQAADFDKLNASALSHYPQALVVEAELDREHGREVYDLELHHPDGCRISMELDAVSGELLKQKNRRPSGRLPLALREGEVAPSWNDLNALALAEHPGGHVEEASLRRMSDGRLLYEVDLYDAQGQGYEKVLNAKSGEIISSRKD